MSNVATIHATAPRTGSAPWRDAVAGVAATAAALGVSELLAGVLPGATSLVAAIGQVIIDNQPPGAKDVVVSLFGTNDKLAFELIIVAIALVDRGRSRHPRATQLHGCSHDLRGIRRPRVRRLAQ